MSIYMYVVTANLVAKTFYVYNDKFKITTTNSVYQEVLIPV